MRTRNPNMRSGTILLCIIVTFIVLFQQSCKKIDINNDARESNPEIINKFFNLPANTPNAVKRVAAELERQNKMTGFISSFATKEGFIRWNKANISIGKHLSSTGKGEEEDTTVILPYQLESASRLDGFIKADLDEGSVKLYLYRASDYSYFPYDESGPQTQITARRFALYMMALEKQANGISRFRITDSGLFPAASGVSNDSTIIELTNISLTVTGKMLFQQTCYKDFEWHCTGTGPCAGGVCDLCSLCITITTECSHILIGNTVDPTSGTGSGGGGSSPNGGGSGSSSPDPCGGRLLIDGNTPAGCGGNHVGWEPQVPITDPPLPPCERIKFVTATNMMGAQYRTALQTLVNSRGNHNYETGLEFSPTGGSPVPLPVPSAGTPAPIDKKNGGRVQFAEYYARMIVHVHPNGVAGQQAQTMPIFSPQDILSVFELSLLCDNSSPNHDHWIDLNKFVFGVINSKGEAYFLSIDDPVQFAEKMQAIVDDPVEAEIFNKQFTVTDDPNSQTALYESQFLGWIQKVHLSVSLMKASPDFTTFNRLSLDNSGNVQSNPCN